MKLYIIFFLILVVSVLYSLENTITETYKTGANDSRITAQVIADELVKEKIIETVREKYKISPDTAALLSVLIDRHETHTDWGGDFFTTSNEYSEIESFNSKLHEVKTDSILFSHIFRSQSRIDSAKIEIAKLQKILTGKMTLLSQKQYFDNVLNIASENLFQTGIYHYLNAAPDSALVRLYEASELISDNAAIYFFLGLTYMKKLDYENSIASFEKALWLNKDYNPVYYYCALSYLELKTMDKAIEYLELYLAAEKGTSWHGIMLQLIIILKTITKKRWNTI